MQAMQAQMVGVLAVVEAKTPNIVDDLIGRTASPFILTVMECPLPLKFKMSVMDTFNGSKDPMD